MFNWKVFVAEFIGTFALVFIGAGAGASSAGLVGVALAHGFTVAAFVYVFGNVSGAHFNPAVTLGLALQGAVKWTEVVFYWLAQFVAAISAAGFLHMVANNLGGTIQAGATVGVLTNYPAYATILEALLTFFLVTTILHTAVAGKGGVMTGLAIGMTLIAAILVGGPLTGASLNPARTFGPAMYIGSPSISDMNTYVIYFLGPFLGAALAALLFNFMSAPDVTDAVVEETAPAKKAAVRKKAVKAKK